MAETLSITVPDGTRDKLDRLARATGRSAPDHAAAAMAGHVERELAIVESIERGLADMRAGRTVSHDDVMIEVDAVIERLGRSGTGE